MLAYDVASELTLYLSRTVFWIALRFATLTIYSFFTAFNLVASSTCCFHYDLSVQCKFLVGKICSSMCIAS